MEMGDRDVSESASGLLRFGEKRRAEIHALGVEAVKPVL
jgi:hypothetical protein